MILAETLPELLTNPAHLMFEAITGLVEFGIGAIISLIWVKYHDRKKHAHQHCEDVHGEEEIAKTHLVKGMKHVHLVDHGYVGPEGYEHEH